MADELLHDFEDWYAAVVAPLQPAARRKLNRELARELRKRVAKRISAQQNPDGSAWTPRKRRHQVRDKQGRIKRQSARMYLKMKQAKHLHVRGTTEKAQVYFRGRDAHIARVAQYGLSASPGRGDPPVKYPQRKLLGFSADDRAFIRDFLIQRLSG